MKALPKGSWVTRSGLARVHYVLACGGDTLADVSLCGNACTTEGRKWYPTNMDANKPSKLPCKHCLKLLDVAAQRNRYIKDSAPVKSRNTVKEAVTVTDSSPFAMFNSPNEDIPLAWVPVPDLEVVMEILKRQGTADPDDPCRIKRDTRHVAIEGLRRYIYEAKKRDEKLSVGVTTVYPGEEEDNA